MPWGVVHLDAGEHAAAENTLEEALSLFEEIGMVIDAIQTLVDLARLYVSSGRRVKLTQVTLRFVALMSSPEARAFTRDKRQEILRHAVASGLDVACMGSLDVFGPSVA